MTTPPEPRHRWPDRLFHWAMALTIIILSLSAFLPIAGIQFDWLPWHWISGLALTLLLVFHILRAVLVQGLSNMLPYAGDKYDFFQKSYHWLIAATVLALTITGLLMLLKLDTVFWDRDPSLLSDVQWGYVYVIHGGFALLLIFLTLVHIYFALLPEHKPLLRAMLSGRNSEELSR